MPLGVLGNVGETAIGNREQSSPCVCFYFHGLVRLEDGAADRRVIDTNYNLETAIKSIDGSLNIRVWFIKCLVFFCPNYFQIADNFLRSFSK